jgi:hypothetical protein
VFCVINLVALLAGCTTIGDAPAVPSAVAGVTAAATTAPAGAATVAPPAGAAAQATSSQPAAAASATTVDNSARRPTLTDVAVTPKDVTAGSAIELSYTINSPVEQKVSLGGGVAPAGTTNYVWDPSNDRTLSIPAGTSVVTRTYTVGGTTPPGKYDVIWGLWSEGFREQYGQRTSEQAVAIAAPAANPSGTTGSAGAPAANPSGTTGSAGAPAACLPPAAGPAGPRLSSNVAINVSVDPTPGERRISPYIYGIADSSGKDAERYRDLGTTILRWGGNARTRHNWEINASNAGSDWEFRNVSQGEGGPGGAGDAFVRRNQVVGAASLLTIPTIGYVAKDGNNDTRSTDVPERSGPPVQPGSEAIAGYDPAANQRKTSVKSVATKGQPFADPPDLQDSVVYQDEWVNHLVKTFGRADAGGVRFYALDNEPDLWSDDTHIDIHPARMSYDSMLSMFEEYSKAIKAVDPSAQIVAPVVSGLTGMLASALDRGEDAYATMPDRKAHGNVPFLAWFLQEIQKRDRQSGRRSLDVLAVHHYPQNGVYPSGDDPEKNALRLRSTQQLWKADYTDESWINRTETPQLQLIPRLREWVNLNYPGTKIAITEWNYGNDDHINGGLAIADVLGIFGREGLDLANYWGAPPVGSPGASAFKLYGNYNNCGGHFGDQLLKTTSSDEQTLAAYGSRDSKSGDILVVAINKAPDKAVEGRFSFGALGARAAQVYQFDGQQTAIHRLADVRTNNGALAYTVPAYSATLFVIKP